MTRTRANPDPVEALVDLWRGRRDESPSMSERAIFEGCASELEGRLAMEAAMPDVLAPRIEIHCASCGMTTSVAFTDPVGYAQTAASHLRECPTRWRAHPAFGLEPRWKSSTIDGDFEIAWTTAGWGIPFHLDEVPA